MKESHDLTPSDIQDCSDSPRDVCYYVHHTHCSLTTSPLFPFLLSYNCPRDSYGNPGQRVILANSIILHTCTCTCTRTCMCMPLINCQSCILIRLGTLLHYLYYTSAYVYMYPILLHPWKYIIILCACTCVCHYYTLKC